MIDRGGHIEFKKRKLFLKFSLCPLRFVFLFFLFPLSSFANVIITDTTKQHYELNDPRNPDCPCHKYQKLAEDEFKKQQGIKNISGNINVTVDNAELENDKYYNKSSLVIARPNAEVHKHEPKQINIIRRNFKGIKKIKFRISKIRNKTKRVHADYSVCFKW